MDEKMKVASKRMVDRAKMVKAMEFIARNLNNEEIFYKVWLTLGVADGDIEYGDLDITVPLEDDIVLDYIEDDGSFAELMQTFLNCMYLAYNDGGLYCGGVVSE